MERDTASGNDYDHARYCSSVSGRFLSPDRVRGRLFDPQSWNRYTYAANNPLKYVDPNGLEAYIFIVAPDRRDRAATFGHTAIYVTSKKGNAGVSFGGDFHFERGPQAFIEAYTRRSGRAVMGYRLRTTPEQDESMVALIKNPKTNPEQAGQFRILENNCATAVCSVLKAGGVISTDSNPASRLLGLVDTPGALEESLESGELSDDVASQTHYPAPSPDPSSSTRIQRPSLDDPFSPGRRNLFQGMPFCGSEFRRC